MAPMAEHKKVQVLHGPNLNMLGKREPAIYGMETLEAIDTDLQQRGANMAIAVSCFQSNHEGDLVEKIQDCADGCDGLIINPAAFTHTSIAIRDALLLLAIPVIEVHLSNIYKREAFRHHSMIAGAATGQITGLGPMGYRLALDALAGLMNKKTGT